MDKRKIHVGCDYFERIEGNAQITTGASVHGDAAELIQNITPESSKEEILQLFPIIQQELAKLTLPEEMKDEIQNELKGAEIQLKKEPANKEGMVSKLESAVAVIKETNSFGKEVVAFANLIGKVIEWGGAMWLRLMV